MFFRRSCNVGQMWDNRNVPYSLILLTFMTEQFNNIINSVILPREPSRDLALRAEALWEIHFYCSHVVKKKQVQMNL